MIAALLALMMGTAQAGTDGVFVLGVDGMDPDILQRMIDEGRLPNLDKLASSGTFQELGTSTPPQSPVAWSNFVTGMNPGGHGVYDFIHRDPRNYHPISSATPASTEEPKCLDLFGFVVPLSGGDAGNNRGGVPFWDLLHDNGVHAEVYRIPGNFPTPPSEARVLGGMGTVDMRGGYGTYSVYTDQPVDPEAKGDVQRVTVQDYDLDGTPDTASGTLRGPPDVFHLPCGAVPKDSDLLSARVTFTVDPEHETILIDVGGHKTLLAEGEWSDWIEVDFDALPMGMMPLSGIVRFYAKSVKPELMVYASPVNLSPAAPAMPITSPDDFSVEIHDEIGHYYTQGMPEDTNALKDGVFDDDDYVKQVALVQEDTRRMLDMALKRFEPGDATFVYLSDIDLQAHMLWRHNDPKYPGNGHPARDGHVAHAHSGDIEGYYEDVDEILGHVQAKLPDGTMLMVMSDHGFQPYTRKFHLNGWLQEQGYLTLKDGATTGHIAADAVDWSKTKAYGLGFNGLYLNLKGREGEGIVAPGDADALMAELTQKLTAFTDPEGGAKVVLEVSRASEVYSGGRLAEAPDLVVGYDKTYGCSDESTLGEITETIIEDNLSKWSGNHLMSPKVVPGVLLVNRKLEKNGHDLTDLTATLLDHYGVAKPAGMVGESIF